MGDELFIHHILLSRHRTEVEIDLIIDPAHRISAIVAERSWELA